jgi:hypothetical protein
VSAPGERRAFIGTGNHHVGGFAPNVFPSDDGLVVGSIELAPHITAFCYSGDQAREIAQAFADLGTLLDQAQLAAESAQGGES